MKKLVTTVLLCTWATYAYSASMLEKMSAVFVGHPSQQEIKRHVDNTLREYGLPISEDNYNRVGSVLVRLRQQAESDGRHVTEMQILACAEAANPHKSKVMVQLPDMLGLCSTPDYGTAQ